MALIATGAAWALLLVAAALASGRILLVALGTLAGACAVSAVAVFAPRRFVPFVFVAFATFVYLPIDKYFGYRPQVGGWPGIRVSVADLSLAVLAISAALGWCLRRTRNGLPPIVVAVYGLILAQYAVSLLGAPRRDLGLFEIASAVHAFAISFVLAALFRREWLRSIIAVVACAVVLHTTFAAAQALTGRPVGWDWFGAPQDIVAESLLTGAVRLRPAGLFAHPVVYANFLLLSLPVVAAGVFVSKTRWGVAGLATAFLVGVSGLALTLSRGAWISTALAAAVALTLAVWYRLFDRRAIRLLLRGGVAVLLLGLLFAPQVYERFAKSQPGNVRVRFDLNEIAVSMMRAHPVAGVGIGNFVQVMDRYDPKDVASYFPAPVHNLYLLEGAEAGLPGLVLFVGLFSAILVTALRRLHRARDPALQWVGAALVGAVCGFGLSQLADFSHRLEPLRSIVWMSIGLLFGVVREGTEHPGNRDWQVGA